MENLKTKFQGQFYEYDGHLFIKVREGHLEKSIGNAKISNHNIAESESIHSMEPLLRALVFIRSWRILKNLR